MTSEKCCLRWKDHQFNFISVFSSLLTCEALVDVTLAAEGSHVQAHKVVLSACSSYFQSLFTANPCPHPIVILKDVQFAHLKVIIDFIYNGEVNVSQEELPHIVKTAELLNIKGLAEIALELLASKQDNTADKIKSKLLTLLTVGDLNRSSEVEPSQPTLSSCPSPSKRKKRSRKASTGSTSVSIKPPLEEQQTTDNELLAILDGVDIKLESNNLDLDEDLDVNLDVDYDFEILPDGSHQSIKIEIVNSDSDQMNAEDELNSCIESTSMNILEPAALDEDPAEEEQHPIGNEEAAETRLNSLPEKSRRKYEFVYRRFKDWCKKKEATEVTESLLLEYFLEKSKNLNSATLWCEYSIVKTSLAAKVNIDIRKFSKLTAFLKRKAVGYCPKKSKVFTRDQFYKFLIDAPDEKYLMMKVVAIIGIAGSCSRDELQRMTVDDVDDVGSILVVKIPKSTSTGKPRSFVVSGKEDDSIMVNLYRRYKSSRASHTKHDRLFVQFRQGKCTVQVVGVHTFGKIPSEIAKYLGLSNPSHYTGQCFKRSAAAMLVDRGADATFSLK